MGLSESDIVAVNTATDSRYKLTRFHVDDRVAAGRVRTGLWVAPAIPVTEETSTRLLVRYHNRLRADLLSLEAYGTTRAWWSILWASNKKFVFGQKSPEDEDVSTVLTPGDSLVAPDISVVRKALLGE